MTVMLVDDDPIEGELLAVAARREGVAVALDQRTDGEGALARLGALALQQDLPDVLLLDVNMPMMTGPEFLQRVRADGRIGTVPVIAYSSSRLAVDVQRMREGACTAYLEKPGDLGGLRDMLRELLAWWAEGAELRADLLKSA